MNHKMAVLNHKVAAAAAADCPKLCKGLPVPSILRFGRCRERIHEHQR